MDTSNVNPRHSPGAATEYPPALLDIRAASAYTGLTVRHLRDLTYARSIPHVRVGRLVRFRLTDLDRWLGEHVVGEHS